MIKQCRYIARGVVAYDAILIGEMTGRYVIGELANCNYIVVARCAVINDTGMTIGSRFKGTNGMAIDAILVAGSAWRVGTGRHMIGFFTSCINSMAGLAVVQDAGMIGVESGNETISVMAISAIGVCCRMDTHSRCFSACINTVVISVTNFAWL